MEEKLEKILLDLNIGYITVKVAKHKILRLFDVSCSLPLADLEKRLDEALNKETPETLNKWLEEKRK